MFGFTQRSGRRSQARNLRARRPRSFNASLERVEERTLMSTLSAISWKSGGVQHSEVFAIGYNNSVSMSKDGGKFVSEGGYVTAISAGLDAQGNPEVFAVGGNNAAYVNDNGAGWVSWGGYVKAISASGDNTVFAIGGDNGVYINRGGTGWTELGGDFSAISAGLDAQGNPEVYGINATSNAVYSSDNGAGLVYRSGYAKAISGSVDNTVFAIGGDNAVYINRSGTSWTDLGGYAKQISAGVDTTGNPEVYVIGGNNAAYVSDNGGGFGDIGGYVTEISGTANGGLFARGTVVDSVYVSNYGLAFNSVGSVPLTDPASATGYSPAPSSAPLYNSSGPSYLDVEQGVAADCWLLASLAEVAARDPQDIKNMFTYDGTTVDNGATVGLYTVQFFNPNGSAFDVEVDTDLPSAGEYYDHVDNALGTQALWVALAEKGYAEANALGLVTTNNEYQGCYSALNYGDPSWALQAITGKSASDYSINPTNIATAWNSGQLVVLCTPDNPPSSYIVGNHCYAMVGYNASSGDPFEVFNPWGTQSNGWAPGETNKIYGLFIANAAFISQNFDQQSFGTGTTNTNDFAGPAEEFIGPATFDNARPKKVAIVQGSDSYNTAVSQTRPATVTGTDLDPQRLPG
jgi:Calpain family cysteine protease/Tectonin domain